MPIVVGRLFIVTGLILGAAGCGGSSDVDGSASQETDASSTVNGPEVTSTTVAVSDDDTSADAEREFVPFGSRTLVPGWYATSQSSPVIRFQIPEHGDDVRWFGRLESEWGITAILYSEDDTAAGREPGFALSMAEEGATVESVVAAMQASQPESRFSFSVASGRFAGREAEVATWVSKRDNDGKAIIEIKTGERSYFNALNARDRILRSYVYEMDGRVLITSFDAHVDQHDMIVAEGAAIMESMEMGEMGEES